jgi:hypothetical protein
VPGQAELMQRLQLRHPIVQAPMAGAAILPFPLQNGLMRPMRTAAAKQGAQSFCRCGQVKACAWRDGNPLRNWWRALWKK